ncbi:hypothetical protein ABLO03_12220, partial [Mycobacterium tuberculosis]
VLRSVIVWVFNRLSLPPVKGFRIYRETLSRFVRRFTGSIAAGAIVITIPIIVFVLIFQRRIVAGLTSGAVKG